MEIFYFIEIYTRRDSLIADGNRLNSAVRPGEFNNNVIAIRVTRTSGNALLQFNQFQAFLLIDVKQLMESGIVNGFITPIVLKPGDALPERWLFFYSNDPRTDGVNRRRTWLRRNRG